MFSNIVKIYRDLNRPEVVSGAFSFVGQISFDVLERLREVEELPPHFGNFEEFSVENNNVSLEFKLPSSEVGKFYVSIAAFIADNPTLNFGEIPSDFYIVDIDYYSRDEKSPEPITRIRELCRLIRALSALASGGSYASSVRTHENKLLFVLAADGKSPAKTLALPIKITIHDLQYKLLYLKFIEVLSSAEFDNEIHVEERRSIMRLTIAEVLSVPEEESNLFSYLVRNWRVVLDKYRHNFLAFLNQYSFEKVRKEIATAEVDHATKLSGVLGDIAGKLLALPVSFAAIILLRKAATQEEFWIIFLGLLVITIIFSGVLWNQWLQVKRLRGSFDFIFGQYSEDAFPKKLRLPVATAKANILRQYRVLKCTFFVFGFLAILPAVGAIYVWLTPLPWTLSDFCVLLSTAATAK